MLKEHHKQDLEGFEVVSWYDFVVSDIEYKEYRSLLKKRSQTDHTLSQLLKEDAIGTYTPERVKCYPDKQKYINAVINDLIEQALLFFVALKKKYRAILYPGNASQSGTYISNTCLPVHKRIRHVKVWVLFL